MVKLLVGLLKGAVIGGGIGYGAYALTPYFENAWLTVGLVGAFVGLLVGRPIWSLIRDKNATTVIALLKAAFGFGIGCGLYAIVAKAAGLHLEISGVPNGGDVFAWEPTLGGMIGAVYGAFVELDDSIGDDAARTKAEKTDKGEKADKVERSAPVKKLKS